MSHCTARDVWSLLFSSDVLGVNIYISMVTALAYSIYHLHLSGTIDIPMSVKIRDIGCPSTMHNTLYISLIIICSVIVI